MTKSVSGVYFSRRFYELNFQVWGYEGKNHDGDGKNCRLNDSMEVFESDTGDFLYIVPAPRCHSGFADHTERLCQNEQKW